METNGNEGKKCYLYERVSTSMQVDNYSLDAQEERLRKRADYEGMIIAGVYRDEGKSGKSVEGRPEFVRMLEDIESKKDDVSFVLVFKLSRFGRNAADVLTSLKRMRRYGVNLICVEESIDSSKDSGKLIITVLSAVAEIERENILVQTMEGRKQKAREGKWNGGFAPYGYTLVNGELVIEEDEAELVREIFRLYTTENLGVNGVTKRLNQRGIKKKKRQNGTLSGINTSFVRGILDNPVYAGKIAYGRRHMQLKEGSDYERTTVKKEDYILVDGQHDPIISKDVWAAACHLRESTRGRHVQKYNFGHRYLLSGILRCPVCGSGMYGNINRKIDKETKEIKYQAFYYVCKYGKAHDGHNIECDYRTQWRTSIIDGAVEAILLKIVREEKFNEMISNKIGAKIDTDEIDTEISSYTKELQKAEANQRRYMSLQNDLDPDDRHYERKMRDFSEQIEHFYDEIADIEYAIEELEKRKEGIRRTALTADNIFKYLKYFDKVYEKMSDEDKRSVYETLIDAVYIYPERQQNGQILKQIDFKFPLFYGGVENVKSIVWDCDGHVETVIFLTPKK